MTLKEKVLYTLRKDQESRNSDIRLTQMVWFYYHKKSLFYDGVDDNGKWSIHLSELHSVPCESFIGRERRKIQEEALKSGEAELLPTSLEVVKQRKINELRWREKMSKSNPSNY